MSSQDGSPLRGRCTALTANGSPCRAWAARGSEPPRCAAHSGKSGAPAGSPSRLKHGQYAAPGPDVDLTTIDGVIADLADRQARLTAFLERVLVEGGDVIEVAKVFALHGQNASRLGRLLRDKRALSGQSADGLLEAIGVALDEISTELGIRL